MTGFAPAQQVSQPLRMPTRAMLRCLSHTARPHSCKTQACAHSSKSRSLLLTPRMSPFRCHRLLAANGRGWAPLSGQSALARRRCPWRPQPSGRRQVSPKAIFGVGAPEAVLVGVVALVIFGPKGLAEAVKSLGKTLKTFQPTIREVISVSSELRNTLEEQIGLDDIRSELRSSVTGDARPTARNLTDLAEDGKAREKQNVESVEQLVEDSEADLERKRSAAAAAAWGGQPPAPPAEVQSVPQVEFSSMHPSQEQGKSVQLQSMSLEELEAELARRKGQQKQEVS